MEGFTLTKQPFIGTKGFIWIERLQKPYVISNFQNNRLIANPEEGSATFEPEVQGTLIEKPSCFYLNIFKEVNGHEDRLPVAISYVLDFKEYIFCVEGGSVLFKETEFPETIPSETSKFIFYQRKHCDGFTSLESSLERGSYLASCEVDQNLILKPCPEDEIDETAKLRIDECESNLESSIIQPDFANIPYHFQNIHSDLLIANPTNSIATFKSDGHPKDDQTVFYLSTYKSNDMSTTALPVGISCHVGEKNYTLCVGNHSVMLKEGKLPEVIAAKTSEYIFLATDFSDAQSDNFMKFESSSEHKCFLAWQTTDPEKKLILKKDNVNDIDETKCFALKEKN